jgi:hypothetical protein
MAAKISLIGAIWLLVMATLRGWEVPPPTPATRPERLPDVHSTQSRSALNGNVASAPDLGGGFDGRLRELRWFVFSGLRREIVEQGIPESRPAHRAINRPGGAYKPPSNSNAFNDQPAAVRIALQDKK